MAMAGEDVSLWTALGLVAAAFIPVWAAVVWLAKTSSPPSRLVAQGRWAKLIAWLAYGLAAIVLANWGWISVYHGLLGPSRRTEQRVVYGTAIALQLLWIVAAAWAEKRHRGAIVSPPATG